MPNRTIESRRFATSDEATTAASQLKAKTESLELAEANDGRVALIVSNLGEQTVYLALGGTAAKEKGIALRKESAPFVIDFYSGVVTCYAHEGEQLLSFSEV